jgi:hypothetical protein
MKDGQEYVQSAALTPATKPEVVAVQKRCVPIRICKMCDA